MDILGECHLFLLGQVGREACGLLHDGLYLQIMSDPGVVGFASTNDVRTRNDAYERSLVLREDWYNALPRTEQDL